MTNRQISAMETRKKILNAGRKIICEKGLGSTSVEEITEAAGVAKGTFYTYFRRKEEIVFELSRDMFGEILENAKAFPGSFLQKLTCYMVNFSAYIEAGSVKLAQEWVKTVVCPAPAREGFDRGKLSADLEAAENLILYGINQRLLRENTPSAQIAHVIVDLLYGQMLCWSMSDGKYSLRERTEEFCARYLEQLLQNYI